MHEPDNMKISLVGRFCKTGIALQNQAVHARGADYMAPITQSTNFGGEKFSPVMFDIVFYTN